MSKLHSACTNDEGDQGALRVSRVFVRIRTSSVRAHHECAMARKSCESRAHTWNSRDCETLLFCWVPAAVECEHWVDFFFSEILFLPSSSSSNSSSVSACYWLVYCVFSNSTASSIRLRDILCVYKYDVWADFEVCGTTSERLWMFSNFLFLGKRLELRIVTISSSFHRSSFSTFCTARPRSACWQ